MDLKAIADSPEGSEDDWRRQANVDEWMTRSRLRLRGDRFYGRQVQVSMLLHLFQSSVLPDSSPLMATISGSAGTGISSLVKQIKKPLHDLGGCFV